MKLEPLYRVTFRYPEAWFVELEGERGTESEHFLIAEGRAEGRVAGRFRGANHPHRRTDLTYAPDFQGYRWLNDVVCAIAGEVRPRADAGGVEIHLEVAELVWEPLNG